MILFQDSDSICKRYLNDEDNVDETVRCVEAADFLAASMISYVEVRGVLARARRARRFRSVNQYVAVVSQFEADWSSYHSVNPSHGLILEAGRLAELYYLTGLDAIILASAREFASISPGPVTVSTWDKKSGLIQALLSEGLSLAHEVNT